MTTTPESVLPAFHLPARLWIAFSQVGSPVPRWRTFSGRGL
jgi:hypothetical protein